MASVKVVLQPRLGWPWQFEDGRLSTTFGEILDAYMPQNANGWHSSCYSIWVGDQLVRRDKALSDVTNGSIGLVVCTLHTPDDTAAQKVAKCLVCCRSRCKEMFPKTCFFPAAWLLKYFLKLGDHVGQPFFEKNKAHSRWAGEAGCDTADVSSCWGIISGDVSCTRTSTHDLIPHQLSVITMMLCF